MNPAKSPLLTPGLARRLYPFLGLAVVGITTVEGVGSLTSNPVLIGAVVIGALLAVAPLVPDRVLPKSRAAAAAPVAIGFALAAYPLWSTAEPGGIAAAALLMLVGCSLILVPWEGVPRRLHAAAPIGGLFVAMVVEARYGSSVLHAFPYVLLPLLFLALYFSNVEFAIGSVLAVANVAVVALTNPTAPDSGLALLAAVTLVALGLLVRRVVTEEATAEAAKSELLADLAQRNQQLQEMTRMKSEFLATMSHEIRTPMNGVIGMTSLLLGTELTEEQLDYVETIRTSGDHLLEIINDILDFSKIEAGRVRMESVDFSPKHVTEEAVELFAEAAHNKGIELIVDVEPDLPAAVVGDPGRLRQVLLNLVGNAVKFTDEGEIVVHAERKSARGPGVLLRFEVSDTGIGLSAEDRARIFSTYSQVDSSTTRRHGGTGLGLAIARMITQLMGGEIGVESDKGAGSKFWFTALFRESEGVVVPASAPLDLTGTSVAIIDDNRTNRTILERYLDSWGMAQASFESGPQALAAMRGAAARDEPFDVAIVDMMMPGMDGGGVAAAIRVDDSLKATVIVLLTSAGHSEKPVPGVDVEMVKPVRPSQLFDVLHSLLAARPERFRREEEAPAPPRPQHGARVLVVEDNAANLKVAVRMVERLGYRADTAGNGDEAVKVLRTVDYDAVLMDCQMPEMDGYEATRQIRREEDHHTPIIAMTASAMAGDRERCLAAGMDDYVSKPIKLHVVAAVLERWLGAPAVEATSPP